MPPSYLNSTSAFGPFVGDLDPQAAGQEGGFTKPFEQGLEIEVEFLENLVVRQEGDLGARLFGRLSLFRVR